MNLAILKFNFAFVFAVEASFNHLSRIAFDLMFS
jgi:hypothetical protein